MALYLRGMRDLRGSAWTSEGTVSVAEAIKGLDCLGYYTASSATSSTGIGELRPAIERLGDDLGYSPVYVGLTSSGDISIQPGEVAQHIKDNQCELGKFERIFGGVTSSIEAIANIFKDEDTDEENGNGGGESPPAAQQESSKLGYYVLGGAGVLLATVIVIVALKKKK